MGTVVKEKIWNPELARLSPSDIIRDLIDMLQPNVWIGEPWMNEEAAARLNQAIQDRRIAVRVRIALYDRTQLWLTSYPDGSARAEIES
jgi:hypothetical protein